MENITEWALGQFRVRYGGSPSIPPKGGEDSSPPLPLGEGLGERATGEGETGVWTKKPPLPPKLLARARELRQNATDAERLLWKLLRNRQLGGAKFRRQHPFGNFILDFYCHQAKLAIELDGGGHAEPEQAQYDAARTEALAAEGVQVLRFWNNDVLKNTEGVLETILEAVSSRTGSPSPQLPSPQPSPRGRGSQAEAERAPTGRGSQTSPLMEGTEGATPTSPLMGGTEGGAERTITKPDIFHYVYAVLHHPAYREKYKLNLKREFPRIPFYEDFWQWAGWGRRLMELHLHYETSEPYPLQRSEQGPSDTRWAYKAKLKAVKDRASSNWIR